MKWTAKEMDDAIGVDKQRVYRYLKANCIPLRKLWEYVKTALEHTTESLRAAQALHAGTIQQQLAAESTAAVDSEDKQSDQNEESGFRTWRKNFWGLK